MSRYNSVEVWLNSYKWDALEQILETQGTDIETVMQERLIELYADQVPMDVQIEIRQRLDTEALIQQQARESNRCFAVFQVVEAKALVQDQYFLYDHSMKFFDAAGLLRRYLHGEEGKGIFCFSDFFGGCENISKEDFEGYVSERLEDTGRVTGVFDFNFYDKTISTVHIENGWQTFFMPDVNAALFHANRKMGLTESVRWDIFHDGLRGKELTSARHLSARNISFYDEIMEMDGRLNFYLNTNFNVDKMFGTNVETAENDDWLNVYANFDMESRQVCDKLDIELHRGDGGEEVLSYVLDSAEKKILYTKMDEYCRHQSGRSLSAYCDELLQEQDPTQTPTMG